MISLEEMKALKALINIKENIARAKRTGIGLCHCGIFSEEVEDYLGNLEDDADGDTNDEKDESESK